MKALKILGIVIVVLVLVVAVLGMVAPNSYVVERTLSINASKDLVMGQLVSLKERQTWSPWVELDPNQEVSYEGEDGQVGAVVKWSGNEDVGKGEQLITEITDDAVSMQLKFIEPYEDIAMVKNTVSETDGGVDVAWIMEGNMPFPMNIMGLFMNMDEMIGKDFERGLAMLKDKVEPMQAELDAKPSFDIVESSLPTTTYVGFKDTVKFDDMKEFYGTHFGGAMAALSAAEITPTGPPTAIYWMWDEEAMHAVVAAAIPFQSDEEVEFEGYEVFVLDSSAVLHLPYMGGYENMMGAHLAMDAKMNDSGKELNQYVVEQYATDPGSEPDTSKWLTNIYYYVK